MKILKTIRNKREIKKLRKETIYLDGFFENRFESIAAIGDEYRDDEDLQEIEERFNYIVRRIDELEAINKKGLFK